MILGINYKLDYNGYYQMILIRIQMQIVSQRQNTLYLNLSITYNLTYKKLNNTG
jgi:hypothetical protein